MDQTSKLNLFMLKMEVDSALLEVMKRGEGDVTVNIRNENGVQKYKVVKSDVTRS